MKDLVKKAFLNSRLNGFRCPFCRRVHELRSYRRLTNKRPLVLFCPTLEYRRDAPHMKVWTENCGDETNICIDLVNYMCDFKTLELRIPISKTDCNRITGVMEIRAKYEFRPGVTYEYDVVPFGYKKLIRIRDNCPLTQNCRRSYEKCCEGELFMAFYFCEWEIRKFFPYYFQD